MSQAVNASTETRAVLNLEGIPPYSLCYLTQSGNIPRRILDRAQTLMQSGWVVTVIAGPPTSETPWYDEESYPNVEICRPDNASAQQILGSKEDMGDQIDALVRTFPIYQWNSLMPFFGHMLLETLIRPRTLFVATDYFTLPIASMAAKYHKSRYIFEVLNWAQPAVSHETKPAYKAMEKQLIENAMQVVTSDFMAAQKFAADHTSAVPTILTWYPRLAEERFIPFREELFNAVHGIPRNNKIFLYSGPLSEKSSGLSSLIDCFAEMAHDSASLVMMGEDIGGKQALMDRAQALGALNRTIFFQAPVGHFEHYSFLASSDIGIVLSTADDDSPNVSAEEASMGFASVGVPILISHTARTTEWVMKNKIGWSACLDSLEESRDAIESVLSEDLESVRGELYRQRLRFCASQQREELLGFFQEMAEKGTQRRDTADFDSNDSLEKCKQNQVQVPRNLVESKSVNGCTPGDVDAAIPFVPHTPTQKPRNILIIYESALRCPGRITVRDILYCYRRYSRDNVFYVNVFYPDEISRELLRRNYDLVVFHTIFLGARWGGDHFWRMVNSKAVQIAKRMNAVKIVTPQDDFLDLKKVNEFINDFNINHVFTVEPETEWHIGFPFVDRSKVGFHKILTGYIDDATLERVVKLNKEFKHRPIDVGYRAWRCAPWLGRHGVLKGKLADVFNLHAKGSGLHTDVSVDDKATLYDDAWFRFMIQCRYFIGVEGGSSMIDFDGTIMTRTDEYVRQNPNASFEEVEQACFPGIDGNFKLFCLSPRHFEAVLTRTGQALVEGQYEGIFHPHRHYLPIKYDLSNMPEVIELMKDENLRLQLCEQSYQDIVGSGKYTYRNFVDLVLRTTLGRGID